MSYEEDYPTIEELLKWKIEAWYNHVYSAWVRLVCRVIGHKFEDKRTFTVKRYMKNYIQQRCRCGESRLLDAETREIIENPSGIYISLVSESLEMESAIWKLLPKQACHGA